MTGGSITTSAKGGNALVATSSSTVTISGTTIKSTGSSSARGLHATYGGSITASNVDISSTGGSCATLATDRGEGTVLCTECTLKTGGSGSPLIYSTGNITVVDTTGTSTAAQAVVVEGKNSATIKTSNLKCSASPNNDKSDGCGVFIYQSMSGDADSGTSYFNCYSSSIEITSDSNYYETSPMFYITNTEAEISLNNCNFTFGSDTFLVADEGSWGTSGSNGGTVALTLTNQKIEGNIEVGDSSSLTITLVNSSITGTINGDKTATKLAITLDSDSTITLTGNSYYTSLSNGNSDNSNIITGTYTWSTYDESSTSTSNSSSTTKTSSSSGGTPPNKPSSSSNDNIESEETESSTTTASTTSTTTSTTTTTTTNTNEEEVEDEDDEFDEYISYSSKINNYKEILLLCISLILI